MMPAIEKVFDLLGDDIVELFTKNETFKIKTGSADEKGLEECENYILKQFDDEKIAHLIISRMEKQMKKQY